MRKIFADTFFWVASINPKDDWYIRVNQTFDSIRPCMLITTDEVLTELLNFYSNSGSQLRLRAARLAEDILDNSDIDVRPTTRQSFLSALLLYRQRSDKGYSLIDCVSMNTMRQLSLTEVLTRDQHFSQEGFITLFKEDK
jgi:predicted nucleic acid-binding protein